MKERGRKVRRGHAEEGGGGIRKIKEMAKDFSKLYRALSFTEILGYKVCGFHCVVVLYQNMS